MSLSHNSAKSGGVMKSNGKIPKKSVNIENLGSKMEKQLQKRSPWYQSIMDPIAGAGARIPDPQGFNTATFQYVLDETVSVNANGYAGLRVISPYPRSDVGLLTNEGGNFQLTTATSRSAALDWGATTVGYSRTFDALNTTLGGNGSPTTSLATRCRVVSGAIYAVYEGTSLSNAGDFILYNNIGGIESNGSPAQTFAELYGAAVLPVNSGKAAVARWLPFRSAAGIVTGGVSPPNAYSLSYDDFPNANGSFSVPALVREFGVIMRGGTPNTGSVRFRVVINYEWIPRKNTGTFIIASPSPVDPMEEAFCMRQLADHQKSTQAISPTTLARTPTSSRVTEASEKETTGVFGALTGAVGFIGDVLDVALPLLSVLLL